MERKKKKINRKHKDRLFLFLFRGKNALLELYNALNGTSYTDVKALEITTLEDAVFMRMKNDVCFLFHHELHLYEHQSTWNPNMPLRGLIYISDIYRGYVDSRELNLCSRKQILLPSPQYLVFYNGREDEPDRVELKLSDSFDPIIAENSCLEFKAIVLNINYGHNRELMEKSKTLHGYSTLIHYIREYQKTECSLEVAVFMAVDRCIKENILREFLLENRGEVCSLLLTEYDEQKFLKSEREVWKEEGKVEGKVEGRLEERHIMSQLITHMYEDGLSGEIPMMAANPDYQEELRKKYKL